MRGLSMLLLAGLLQAAPTPPHELTELDGLRLDEVQIIGTHNSYHEAPDGTLLDYLHSSGFSDGPYWTGPRLARAIAYDRAPLTAQLDEGIRALELDLHDDPDGGRFLHPAFLDALAASGRRPDRAWDPEGAMRRPGFKTLHKAGYDPRSTCPLFVDCLAEVAGWSRAHPTHLPIILMLEVKGDGDAARCSGLCDEGWKRLKRNLRDAFGTTLIEPASITGAWPTLAELRGKILVMLLDDESHAKSYRAATDRDGSDLIFTAARPAKRVPLRPNPQDRIAIFPNPHDPRIVQARRAGMLVYTRADADSEEAQRGDTARREMAFASGATFISTDYPSPNARLSTYSVRFGGGRFVRCNPVTGGQRCASR